MAASFSVVAALPFAVACAALAVSVTTMWLTLIRRGRVIMTRPTVIYFGPDGSKSEGLNNRPKIFLRGLLISTSRRGRIVESLYASIQHEETKQNFSVWVYGDDDLRRGSGLFIGENGLATNHHFLLSDNNNSFTFKPGRYYLQIFANVLGEKAATQLFAQALRVNDAQAKDLASGDCGMYFDWGPQTNAYVGRSDHRPKFSVSRIKGAVDTIIQGGERQDGLPSSASTGAD